MLRRGVIGRLDIEKPDSLVLNFRADSAEKYLPKANTLEIYRLANFPSAAKFAVGLVFGISGAIIRSDCRRGGNFEWCSNNAIGIGPQG